MKSILKSLMTAACIALLLAGGVFAIDHWMAGESRLALLHEIRQAAEHCYAVEGRYPPDLAYLQTHYGIRTEHRRFAVEYRRVAPDRAPEITVRQDKGGAWA